VGNFRQICYEIKKNAGKRKAATLPAQHCTRRKGVDGEHLPFADREGLMEDVFLPHFLSYF